MPIAKKITAAARAIPITDQGIPLLGCAAAARSPSTGGTFPPARLAFSGADLTVSGARGGGALAGSAAGLTGSVLITGSGFVSGFVWALGCGLFSGLASGFAAGSGLISVAVRSMVFGRF
jgi:hypothetical protein